MNEWYARDISKKRKLTNVVKGNAGEPLSPPPYGYKKDPENPKRWVVDPDAAKIVKRIYTMTLEGFGPEQIAAALEQGNILTPLNYWESKGTRRGGKKSAQSPYKWNASTITSILSKQEYCGDVVNFKSYSKSFKLKKRIPNKEENIVIFKDVHEPIIERASWERVQEKRGKSRKRKTNSGEKNLFSGLLICADCGHNLNYHFNQANPEIKYFNCSNYKGNRGTCPTTHYIRLDFLEHVVLEEIKRLTKYVSRYENEFVQAVIGHSKKVMESQCRQKQKELCAMVSRDREINTLFLRMYEDNVAGKLDDEWFAKMTRQYTLEQSELADKIKAMKAELDKETDTAMTTEHFIKLVRKYTRAKKLTPSMVHELIDKIEVFHSERIDGVNVQRLIIHYNCIGTIDIPEGTQIPKPKVLIPTRQGVATGYQPVESRA
jgi:site-specific DNA recombinase